MMIMQQHGQNSSVVLPNTFIGGVGGAYITSPADFVSKVGGITVSDIENFQIDGSNNVSFYVGLPYAHNSDMFISNSNVTWYLDVDDNCIGILTSFRSSVNLKYLYLKGMPGSSTNAPTLTPNPSLLKVNFDSVTDLASRGFLDNATLLKVLRFPSATQMNQGGNLNYHNLTNLTSLERLYIPLFTTFNTNSKNNSILGRQFGNIGIGCKVYYNSNLGATNRTAFNYLSVTTILTGDKFYIDGRVYLCVAGAPASDGEFQYHATIGTLLTNFRNAMTSDTRGGASDFVYTAFVSYVIIEAKLTGTSYEVATTIDGANTGTATFKFPTLIGGNDLHPLLIYFRDERSCVLTELSTAITVNTPTSLSYLNQTANTVDLNFTAPTPNANGTDAYEVWVDDGTVYRKLFEYAEISSSGDTLNLAEVITDVGSLTGVKIKIRTIDGQMNYSDFSNEITIV